MVTFYQQTYGELSRFFLALRDGRLIGSRCGKCQQVMVPAATLALPDLRLRRDEGGRAPAPRRARGDRADHHLPVGVVHRRRALLPRLRRRGDRRADRVVPAVAPADDDGPAAARDLRQGRGAEARLRGHAPRVDPRHLLGADVRGPGEAPSTRSRCSPRSSTSRRRRCRPSSAARPESRRSRTRSRRCGPWPTRSARARAPRRTLRAGPTRSASRPAAATSRCTSPRAESASRTGLPKKPDFVMVAKDPGVFTRWVADGSLTDAAVEGTSGFRTRRPSASCPSSTDCRARCAAT